MVKVLKRSIPIESSQTKVAKRTIPSERSQPKDPKRRIPSESSQVNVFKPKTPSEGTQANDTKRQPFSWGQGRLIPKVTLHRLGNERMRRYYGKAFFVNKPKNHVWSMYLMMQIVSNLMHIFINRPGNAEYLLFIGEKISYFKITEEKNV